MEKKRRPIFQPNELSEAAVVSMRTRILTAIIGIIIVLPCVLVGDWAIFGLICLVCVFGVIEIIRCAKMKYSKALYIVGFVLALLILVWPVLRHLPFRDGWRIFDGYDYLYISATILFIGICFSAFTIIIDKNFTIIDACFIFTTVWLISFGLQCALFLRYLPINQTDVSGMPYFNSYVNLESSLLILFVAVGACLNDAFAYFVGVFFGKHKMNERLSPKKTWEGFFGGVFLSAAFLIGAAFIFSACKHPILRGILDIDHWYHIIILSFIVPLMSTVGDLVFSSIKRHYGIKDFSNLLPGHGGILDRIDSILFATITVAIYVSIFLFRNGGITLP